MVQGIGLRCLPIQSGKHIQRPVHCAHLGVGVLLSQSRITDMTTKPRKFRVKRTVWDALVAYEGNKRVEVFGDAFDAKEWIAARRAEGHTVDAEGVY